MKALHQFKGETTDYSAHALAVAKAPTMNEQKPPKVAVELVKTIHETQANLALVLAQITQATVRGLTDSAGVGVGGGEPIGGTRDFTQQMLNRIAACEDDDSRQHLSMLVASVGAVRDWSKRARGEVFALAPLSLEKAKIMLGDGPSNCLNGNCGRDVWNTPQDRLRAGRCEACYRYWMNKDRGEERPRALCHPEERKENA